MKVSDIDKKYQESMKGFQEMIDKQNNAKREADEFNEAAEAAAVDGDLERYKELKRKAADAEALAYVLQKQIEKNGADDLFTKSEIFEAWSDYADDHNKKLKAKLKKFTETKSDLLRQYAEMVSLQRETCAVRERLCRYIGIGKTPAAPDYGLASRFPMDYIPCKGNMDAGSVAIRGANISDPDAVYYLASMEKRAEDLFKDPDGRRVVEVVGFHRA